MEEVQRFHVQEIYNATSEYGTPFVLWCLERAIYNLGRTTEERIKEFDNIRELLQVRDGRKAVNQYPYLTISEIAKERYGMNVSFDNRTICPFHEGADNPTSFKFDNEKNRFICFSCGISGNIVQFVKLMEEKLDGER